MADEVVEKAPSEVIAQDIDFTELLPDDTTISASAATATKSDGSSAAILGSVTDVGMIISFNINATVDGEDYLITVTAPGGSSGQTRVYTIEVRSRLTLKGTL